MVQPLREELQELREAVYGNGGASVRHATAESKKKEESAYDPGSNRGRLGPGHQTGKNGSVANTQQKQTGWTRGLMHIADWMQAGSRPPIDAGQLGALGSDVVLVGHGAVGINDAADRASTVELSLTPVSISDSERFSRSASEVVGQAGEAAAPVSARLGKAGSMDQRSSSSVREMQVQKPRAVKLSASSVGGTNSSKRVSRSGLPPLGAAAALNAQGRPASGGGGFVRRRPASLLLDGEPPPSPASNSSRLDRSATGSLRLNGVNGQAPKNSAWRDVTGEGGVNGAVGLRNPSPRTRSSGARTPLNNAGVLVGSVTK